MLEYIWHCVEFALSLAMRSGRHTTQQRRRTRNRPSIKMSMGQKLCRSCGMPMMGPDPSYVLLRFVGRTATLWIDREFAHKESI